MCFTSILRFEACVVKSMLKAKTPKVNALLGQSKANLMKCASGVLLWCFLKKHIECLGGVIIFLLRTM